MESYIVRIYRYQSSQPDRLVGTIQTHENPVPFAFTGVEELWTALSQIAPESIDAPPRNTPPRSNSDTLESKNMLTDSHKES